MDLGSTYTKAVAIHPATGELAARAYVPSTASTDVSVGARQALDELILALGKPVVESARKAVCSSAAGGLRIVAIGLEPRLTAEAARLAALGAGGKIVATFARGLAAEDLASIRKQRPDLILLAGGTDGGNDTFLPAAAEGLAGAGITTPVILAGNRLVQVLAERILDEHGVLSYRTENVLPELARLNIEPARSVLREAFLEHIVHAKGLDRAEALLGPIRMPTPMAVQQGLGVIAQALSAGDAVVAVDIGGATVDVVSVGETISGRPVIRRGLTVPETYRTVEADLGIRHNAGHVLALHTSQEWSARDDGVTFEALQGIVRRIVADPTWRPETEAEFRLDTALARAATEVAVLRHAGRLAEVATPEGVVMVQEGKDLTGAALVVGIGGVLVYGRRPEDVLRAACWTPDRPDSLRPKRPAFVVDRHYVCYAIGLMASYDPDLGVKVARRLLAESG